MSLRRRLDQLERTAPPPPEAPPEAWPDETRVHALRNIVARVFGRNDADPFPALERREYLDAFWPWLLDNAESWPRWAQEAAVRIGSPGSAYA